MRHKYYAFYDTSGYSEQAKNDLSIKLKTLGFKHEEGDFGGGVPTEQIIAWLGFHAEEIKTGLIIVYIVKILDKLYDWFIHNKNNKNKRPPVVNIEIHLANKTVLKTYRIDKKYTKKEIKIIEKI
jgi:uncharacterized protein YehS (DUF1456 family)